MASVAVKHEWRVWAGTIEVLATALETAASRLASWAPEDDDGRLRRRLQAVDVTLTQRRDLTFRLDSADELREAVDPRDLGEIERIAAEVGSFYGSGGVQITCSTSSFGPGLMLEVRGPNRAAAQGVMGELIDILRPRERVAILGCDRTRLWEILIPLFLGPTAVVALVSDKVSDSAADVVALVWIAVIALNLVVAALCVSAPPLQVLGQGEAPRLKRWRGRLAAITATAALSVAASILATLIYSGS